MARKKVLHVIDEFKTGGAQTHLVTVLDEMIKRNNADHEVWCLFEDGVIGRQLRDLNIDTRALDLRKLLLNRSYLSMLKKIRSEIRILKPDVMEAHLTWSRLFCITAAWLEGVPIRIGFEHGDIYMNSIKFRLANFVAQLFANHIIVCSKALKRWVVRTHHISPQKLKVIHNCVNTKKFTPSNEKPRESSWPKAQTLFCAVGTLGSGVNKRMDICIKAISLARKKGADVGLLICGDGDQRQKLESLVNSLNVEDHVKFLGMRSDINIILASCDAFCHSAPFEPFGIVCLEAMASSIPVIIPDSGGMPEIITMDYNGFIYRSLSYHELASCMIELSLNQESAALMAKNALDTVRHRFCVEKYVDRVEAYYGLNEQTL